MSWINNIFQFSLFSLMVLCLCMLCCWAACNRIAYNPPTIVILYLLLIQQFRREFNEINCLYSHFFLLTADLKKSFEIFLLIFVFPQSIRLTLPALLPGGYDVIAWIVIWIFIYSIRFGIDALKMWRNCLWKIWISNRVFRPENVCEEITLEVIALSYPAVEDSEEFEFRTLRTFQRTRR